MYLLLPPLRDGTFSTDSATRLIIALRMIEKKGYKVSSNSRARELESESYRDRAIQSKRAIRDRAIAIELEKKN